MAKTYVINLARGTISRFFNVNEKEIREAWKGIGSLEHFRFYDHCPTEEEYFKEFHDN